MSRGEVGDTLRYFEAGQKEAAVAMSRGNSRKFTRGTSSNSLQPARTGLNPEALFSVAAMATAPVGTTVIEDDIEEDPVVDQISAKGKNVVMEHPLDIIDAATEQHPLPDFDLCQQCTKRREQATRNLQEQRQRSDHVSPTVISFLLGLVSTICTRMCDIPRQK